MYKRMMITGAGGMVGKQAADYFREKYAVTALTRTALSITDKEALGWAFETVKPNIVLNCAVIRNEKCLQNKQLAWQVNAEGVRNLSIQCRKFDAILIQLSTDYVFEGSPGGIHTEETPPCPMSLYSRTKRAGEQFALAGNNKTFVIRTGWLYGCYGDNFVHKILRQARDGQEIGILGNQYGNPTSVSELLNMIALLLQTEAYGIYHAVCLGRTSRLHFARQIIREAGLTVPAREIDKDSESRCDTSLSTKKLQQAIQYTPAHWKKALVNYIDEAKHENCIGCSEWSLENRSRTT